MSDPVEELRTFEPGTFDPPLSPPDVRRRGDRRRRHTAALAVFGVVVAVAAIGTPIALLGGDSPESAPAPAAPTRSQEPNPEVLPEAPSPEEALVTEIPANFPLDLDQAAITGDLGMQGPSRQGIGVIDPLSCGVTLTSTSGSVDRLTTAATGPELQEFRDLLVFRTVAKATTVLDEVRAKLEQCPRDNWEGDDRTFDTFEKVTGFDSVTFAMTYDEGPGGGVHQMLRVRNAVLMTSLGGSYTPQSAAATVPERSALAERIAGSMCVFSIGGCPETGSKP